MNALQDQVNAAILIVGAVGSALVGAYQLIVKGGGVRGIWRRFLNGKDKQP